MVRVFKNRKGLNRNKGRSGAALTEFAVAAPILVIIFFGAVDICSAYCFKQTLKIAAYEACRIGLNSGSTTELVKRQAQQMLDSRRVIGYSVEVTPSIESLGEDELLTVKIGAPGNSNLIFGGFFCREMQFQSSVSMMSEK